MTLANIYKRSAVLDTRENESTPFALNGNVYLAGFPRSGLTPLGYEIRDFNAGGKIYAHAWPGMFGCAYVDNGQLYIFGTTGGSGFGNKVIVSTINSSWVASDPVTVWHSNPACDRAWNTSVCSDPTGYVMALETAYNGIIFQHATALTGPWTPFGGLFNRPFDGGPTSFYAACPTIRYINGYYYMFWLKHVGPQFQTVVSRSAGMATGSWQHSSTAALTPLPYEGINNSDFDFAELNGCLYGVYFDGDQTTWWNTRTCFYCGTTSKFVSEFF